MAMPSLPAFTIWCWGQKYDTTDFSALRAHEILKTFAIRSFF